MTSRKLLRCKTWCHHCGELGHIKKYCREFRAKKERKAKPHKAAPSENSDNDSNACLDNHMCQESKSFHNLYHSQKR